MREVVSRHVYVHTDDHGRACLEDEAGNTVYVPKEWLPENAMPGATITVAAAKGADRASYTLTIDLSGASLRPASRRQSVDEAREERRGSQAASSTPLEGGQ